MKINSPKCSLLFKNYVLNFTSFGNIQVYRMCVYIYMCVCMYMLCVCSKLLRSCLTLCDPIDHSSPGSSVHGIFQARILEWVAMPSPKGSSWPRHWTCISYVSCTGRRVIYTSAAKKPKQECVRSGIYAVLHYYSLPLWVNILVSIN